MLRPFWGNAAQRWVSNRLRVVNFTLPMPSVGVITVNVTAKALSAVAVAEKKPSFASDRTFSPPHVAAVISYPSAGVMENMAVSPLVSE
ncbi:hypothetical protein SDC9_182969 [bioreactor metagenome]|uniref:Uncharacterized protein n=1 Tax=bioreactor metagenome TaxID=1076179 RepID=A0A645H8V8_9ZZZZ